MTELKTCARYKCNNAFKTFRRTKFCSSYCCNRHNYFTSEMKYKTLCGLSLDEIIHALPNWTNEQINHYYRLVQKPQIVYTLIIEDELRIMSEEYMINSQSFYLDESDRIPPINQSGQTIKEYLQNQDI